MGGGRGQDIYFASPADLRWDWTGHKLRGRRLDILMRSLKGIGTFICTFSSFTFSLSTSCLQVAIKCVRRGLFLPACI